MKLIKSATYDPKKVVSVVSTSVGGVMEEVLENWLTMKGKSLTQSNLESSRVIVLMSCLQ